MNKIPLISRFLKVTAVFALEKNKEFWEAEGPIRNNRLEFVLFGKKIYCINFMINVGDIYLYRDNSDFFKNIDEMIERGIIAPIKKDDRVFEPGCNVGGILRQIQLRYKCEVYGLDISANAIEIAKESIFNNNSRAHLCVGDVLSYDFAQFEDNYFSHVFCVSHLAHIRKGTDKDHYLEELKRIAQNVVLLEKITTNIPENKKIFYEDYSIRYGFALYKKWKKHKNSNPNYVGLYYYPVVKK